LYKDSLPRKKPFTLKDQIATDKYGRRRFHGAFTGGFSAGFLNSVGSLEGWTPSTFKSSRCDKAKDIQQKPEDYMDEEVMTVMTV
jgi:G patch domain-containing protein 1